MLEAKNLDKEISIKKIDNETTNIKIFNNNVLMAYALCYPKKGIGEHLTNKWLSQAQEQKCHLQLQPEI